MSPPAYFLASHSIELSLKAFLRNEGVSVRDLTRDYGHNLRRCHRKARELGLARIFTATPEENRVIELLDGHGQLQQWRYIRVQKTTVPNWPQVELLATRLYEAVLPTVFDSLTEGLKRLSEQARAEANGE